MEACEENWEKNGDHCYLWNNDAKNWTAAEDFCQQAGGHLASVPFDSTYVFILEGMNRRGLDHLWLGGNDIEEENDWKWTDCTPWGDNFWYLGEPNNAGGAEDCLETRSMNWNDLSCGSELGFLCRKKICSGRTYMSISKSDILWQEMR